VGREGGVVLGRSAHHLYGHHADVEGFTLPQLLRCYLLRHLRSTKAVWTTELPGSRTKQTRKGRH
jgi:hypothetical protein